jgi:hypothetical protein
MKFSAFPLLHASPRLTMLVTLVALSAIPAAWAIEADKVPEAKKKPLWGCI